MLEAVCELSRRWEIPATSAQEGKGPVRPEAPLLPSPIYRPVCLPACSVADGCLHLLVVVQFSASRPGFLTFWDQCTEGLSPFICPVERVLLTFCNQYSARLSLRQPGLAEAGEWAAHLSPLLSFVGSPVMGSQEKSGQPTQSCRAEQ